MSLACSRAGETAHEEHFSTGSRHTCGAQTLVHARHSTECLLRITSTQNLQLKTSKKRFSHQGILNSRMMKAVDPNNHFVEMAASTASGNKTLI